MTTTGRELQETFNKLTKTAKIEEQQTNTSAALGILAVQMTDTISNDIAIMIENGDRKRLDGYIFCLSRIMNKKVAWKCISNGYYAKSEKVPTQYAKLFQADILPPTPPHMVEK